MPSIKYVFVPKKAYPISRFTLLATTLKVIQAVQGLKKWFAKCDKHYPSRSGLTSLATAVTNFTKPRTSHFFGLCTWIIGHISLI